MAARVASVDLRDAACLVTGGSGGIGGATCVALGRAGARTVASGRDREALREVSARTGGAWVAADLTLPGEAERLAEEARAALGPIDVLVNNAGAGWAGPFVDLEPEDIDGLVALNLTAHLRLTRAILPGMLERGRGHVVFVASIAGHLGVRDEAVYSATKAALIRFADSLRDEVAPAGVGVSVVSPGAVATGFFARRGRPYGRSFPRAISAERVARAVVRAVERNRPDVIVPRWLGIPARLKGALPGLYRLLSARFGG